MLKKKKNRKEEVWINDKVATVLDNLVYDNHTLDRELKAEFISVRHHAYLMYNFLCQASQDIDDIYNLKGFGKK